MTDTVFILVVDCTLAFLAGIFVASPPQRRSGGGHQPRRNAFGNYEPVVTEPFDPTEQPPFPIGGTASERPPRVIHVHHWHGRKP